MVKEEKPDRIIDIRKLKVGTTLLLETEKEIYEFKVTNPDANEVEVTGTIFYNMGYTKSIPGVLVGCTDGGPLVKSNEIQLNKKIHLEYIVKKKKNSLTTANVISGKMFSPDGTLNIELWPNYINPYAYDEEKDSEKPDKDKK